MKQFLTRPRSIIGSTLWGIIVAIVILIIILVVGLISSAYRSKFGPVRQIESIAIGGGYSISLNATPAHPMLAEYKQSITLYGGTPRGGENLGNIEIPMNTGGRIRIGVLVPNNFTTKDVILADRYLTTSVNLMSQKTRNIGSWRDGNLKAIGIISGESYPIKFQFGRFFPAKNKSIYCAQEMS